ncbi:alpha/beta hydrolase [Flagellimonas sp.]|uniref:alpha/beta hydrolase n=1 Tax=Flagellimonas sp. TaxID=2058762 RepID=UPI003B5273A2
MVKTNQFNLRLRHPDYQKYLDINERESLRVKKSYSCHLDQKYGLDVLQAMDIFPSNVENAPVLVFIHGGYWRALDKRSYQFVAEPFVKNNFTVCVINYRLIPSVNMETVLLDVSNALIWIREQIVRYNGNPNKLVLSGHSAGGHLALMTYLMNETLRSSIRAICSLSGIFDLDPIKNSYLNEVLQLNDHDVENYSIINKDLSVVKCPVSLSVGTNETEFFIEQSNSLYEENKSVADMEYKAYKHLNHYQMVHELGREDSPLVDFVLEHTN